jgi:A/G-specific adenine glycosylase
VLLRRRPESGLLGGMIEVPSSDWLERAAPDMDAVKGQAPVKAAWRMLPGLVRHTFTHFHLELGVAAARIGPEDGAGWRRAEGIWVPVDRLSEHAIPTVMRKVVRHALGSA